MVNFIGAAMAVILDLSYSLCIWISAVVAIVYTLLGGLYSVAYTDIIQLNLIFFSLVSSYLASNSLFKWISSVVLLIKPSGASLICCHPLLSVLSTVTPLGDI